MPDDDEDGRWEYDYIEDAPRQVRQVIDELNDMGRDGWEAFAPFPSVGRRCRTSWYC